MTSSHLFIKYMINLHILLMGTITEQLFLHRYWVDTDKNILNLMHLIAQRK